MRTKYDTDKSDLSNLDLENQISDADKKIPNINEIGKKIDYNDEITEIENKIPTINGLATTAALTSIKSKTPDVSTLAKKTDYDTKISGIESKYITTADIVANNIKNKGLVNKSGIAGFINNAD